MTERPTEQTHSRLTGLDATSPVSNAPILPPMPQASTSAPPSGRPSLADRLQEKLSAVRHSESSGTAAPERTAETPANRQEQTAVRSAVPSPPATSSAPTAAPEQERPVLPPPAADQPASRAPQQAPAPAKKRTARPGRAAKRPPRRARLRLTRIDPWSVMKTAFLLSIALGVVTIVSVLMVWSVLGAAGVWDSINTTVRDIVGDQASSPFTIQDYLGTDRVIGFTMLVAVIDVVLLTAIATLAAFLYNMAAALLGGIDITLVEDER
jgi:hypothetical protein